MVTVRNIDETGIFWKALPDRGFGVKGKSCHGGKKIKQRITVAFSSQQQGQKKSLFSYGDLKIHDALRGLINLYYLSTISAKQNHG